MGAPLLGVARENAMIEAYRLHIQRLSYKEIAEKLGISRNLASDLVQEAHDYFWTWRDLSELDAEKRRAIDTYEEIKRICFMRLARMKDPSLNISGLANAAINAQRAIDDITGVRAPKQLKTDNRHEYVDLSKLPDETLKELEAYLQEEH